MEGNDCYRFSTIYNFILRTGAKPAVDYRIEGIPAVDDETSIVWDVGDSLMIEIVGDNHGTTVRVRARANTKSVTRGDQKLHCRHTQGDEVTQLTFDITVARPTRLTVVAGPVRGLTPTTVTTRYTYQILDQFNSNLREVYSYVDSRGITNNVRVANLRVSEQLTPINLPPDEAPPEEATNVGVTDAGRFDDTLSSERGVVFEAQQIIKVHTNAWAQGNSGFGDTVRRNRITHSGEENNAVEDP